MALVNDPWSGPEKIVLGVDLGTVFSAVAYSHLIPGGPRSITSVSEWPDQAKASEPRVPTLLWYDRGKPEKCGASALIPNATQAKERGWRLAKLFKLHMHPETMRSDHQFQTSDLPDGITLSQIYSDYMAYLIKHTRHFFEGHVLEGGTVWDKHFQSADIIITHPNGWGVREQHFLRKAAIVAGFPDPQKTRARVRFLTDAEACVHFCVLNGEFGSDWLKRGVQFGICDAGGSTVDITTYEVTRTEPSLLLKETRASASVPAGAVFVAQAAQRDLNNPDKAAYAEFGEPEIEPRGINQSDLLENAHRIIQRILPLLAKVLRILDQIIRILENAVRLENELAQEDAATSLNYEGTKESVPSEGEISLLSLSEGKKKVVTVKNDFSLDVAGGPLDSEGAKESGPIEGAISTFPLNGNPAQASGSFVPGGADSPPKSETTVEVVPVKDAAASFDPYVDMIVAALKKQTAGSQIKRIFLVGGFSKSQYLCGKLIAQMANESRQITVVDDSTAKPAAEGAAICGTQPSDSVDGRASRFSYGIAIWPVYNPTDNGHQGRQLHRLADGRNHVGHEWSAIVPRGRIVKTHESVSNSYVRYYQSGNPRLGSFSVTLYAFTIPDQNAPRFMRDPEGRFYGVNTHHLPRLRNGFTEVCDLSADLSGMSGGLQREWGPDGAFWILSFSVGIEFGGVELQAYVEWQEKGIRKRGRVSILPNQD